MELKYSDTRLYNLKRKRDLKKILNVSSLENYIEKANICYSPYIDKKSQTPPNRES